MRHTELMLSRRRLLALGGSCMAALSAPGLLRAAAPVETLDGRAFATGWRVTLPAGSGAGALRAPIEALLAGIDAQMSPWRGDSDVSRFNAGPAGRRAVPAETARVAAAALGIAEASAGHFDPSVGPLVARWGFGPIAGDARPGWRGIAVEGDALVKDRDGLTLDLCGIAKGRALDRMAALLAEAGHGDFLIDLGGELLARGRHPSGRTWRVGVEDPRPDRAAPAAVLRLRDGAVATSGSRWNGYTLGGRRYSHIIDPQTGAPVAGSLGSVSVLAADAMTADAWATALMAAGAAAPDLARRSEVAALFQYASEDGLRRLSTGGFGLHLDGGGSE